MAKKKQGSKTKASIFREAFEATGTLTTSDNKAVEAWIDSTYSDFSWGKVPTTEISAARSQEKKRSGIPVGTGQPRGPNTPTSGPITASEIVEAMELADQMGGVANTLELINAMGKSDIKRLKASLTKWGAIIEATGGDEKVAAKVLDAMMGN